MSNEKGLLTPNFGKMSYGTLRRYQSFFNIKDEPFLRNKQNLAELVKNHFMNYTVETERVLDSFMKIEKDQNSEKNNVLRKSTRFQEKNMSRFLDNFNHIK